MERRHEMGPGGFCICPKCGKKISHRRGERCGDYKCPACQSKMVREDSYHHRLIREKRSKS